MFSVCVPSSCTAQDVKAHFDFSLNSVNASAIVNDLSCSTNISVPLETKEWIAILVIVLIFMLVALSTAYETSSTGSEKNTLLCAFSLKTNCRQMLSTRTTPAALTCLNGLRVLAMFWVILGHRMFAMLTFPALRPKTILEKIDDLVMAPIENTMLSVEIFFLISGILVTYGYLRYMKKGHKFNLLYFYFHRYCRLTPALAFMVLLYSTIAIRFADGPMWRKFFDMLNSSCRSDWWATLLYINNYYHNNFNMCISQSWFMSSDFQLYLFSPILLIPLHKKPKLGLALIAIFAVISTSGGLWNAIVKDLKGGNLSRESFEKDYIVTHLRAATFLIGMALGYVLFKLKQGELILKLSRARLWAGWLMSLFFILFSVLFITVVMDPEREPSRWVNIPYMIFHRHLFALGFVWIILICTLGHGGWVNQFLSWSVLIPFARLSYGAYLTHMLIQFIDTYSQRGPVQLSHPYLWYHAFADFTLSYLASAALYLIVEGPFANITTWCFEGQKKPKEEENQTELPVSRNAT
uniref:Acyltransferase 3 domain-containing protein n=2 Tax=Cuerna arida TaxID=1464854 RepID=A0A1B6GA25_9HEMI